MYNKWLCPKKPNFIISFNTYKLFSESNGKPYK